MKKLAILGSTGSIGTSTLKVVRHLSQEMEVKTLAAKSNIDLLEQQALEFHPELVAVYDKDKALELQRRLPHITVVGGIEGLKEAAAHESVDFVVSAMTGTIGIIPTIAAIEKGKGIGLANKEVLVAAGQYVTALAAQKGVRIIPIDSEHSALFQCFDGSPAKEVRRLILTASGGPFLRMSEKDLEHVTIDQALSHPTWRMGPKVTIDSSTLMNKGLEVIEAYWLFGLSVDRIDVVIHPQSIIHSMVEFIDGSILAQMCNPDMIIPIQYAITYPERREGIPPPFDFSKHACLEFFPPDRKRFGCLDLAYEAQRVGGTLPCYMNAANEILVSRFVNREIGWREIAPKLERLMQRHSVQKELKLETILEVDASAREEALKG